METEGKTSAHTHTVETVETYRSEGRNEAGEKGKADKFF